MPQKSVDPWIFVAKLLFQSRHQDCVLVLVHIWLKLERASTWPLIVGALSKLWPLCNDDDAKFILKPLIRFLHFCCVFLPILHNLESSKEHY
jgi:hypothetical protein